LYDIIYDSFAVRGPLDTLDLQDFNRYTNNIWFTRHRSRHEYTIISFIHPLHISLARVGCSPFRSTLPLIVIMTHRLSHTTVHNGYIRAYICYMHYIYNTYTHIYPPHREFEVLYSGVISRFESRCDPHLSPVSTQRTCSPCYFGKHLMLIEPLSLFAPCTLPSCE